MLWSCCRKTAQRSHNLALFKFWPWRGNIDQSSCLIAISRRSEGYGSCISLWIECYKLNKKNQFTLYWNWKNKVVYIIIEMFDAKAALLIRTIWWNVIQVIKHTDYSSREEFDMAVNGSLVKAGVEIICLAGFMRVLTGAFVRQWRGRLLNIHPALLPLFKGTHAHRQALDAGVRVTGCTVHFVEVSISILLIDYSVRFAPALRPLELWDIQVFINKSEYIMLLLV